jgi:hypothetical protein
MKQQDSSKATRTIVQRIMSLRSPDKPEIAAYHIDRRSTRTRLRLIERYARRDSKILFVGDDDLVSLGLHLLGYSNISVLDFDRDLLMKIRQVSRDRVETRRFDLQRVYSGELPRLRADFDLVVTDPPYTEDGLRIFSGVGLRQLKANGHALIVFPAVRAERSSVGAPEMLAHALQAFLVASGSLLIEILPRSQRSYHGTISSMGIVKRCDVGAPIDFECLLGPSRFYR